MNKMQSKSYNMAFTSGGLNINKSIRFAELYCDIRDWEETRKAAIKDNVLQAKKRASGKRYIQEIKGRLSLLTDAQMRLLVDGTRFEQGLVLWLAVCKRHEFIQEFVAEVVREKYLHLELAVAHHDFDMFFRDKAELHDEIESLSESTRKKLRQVLFKMMSDAGITTKDNVINPILLTPELASVINEDDPVYFAIFPTSDADIKKALNGTIHD